MKNIPKTFNLATHFKSSPSPPLQIRPNEFPRWQISDRRNVAANSQEFLPASQIRRIHVIDGLVSTRNFSSRSLRSWRLAIKYDYCSDWRRKRVLFLIFARIFLSICGHQSQKLKISQTIVIIPNYCYELFTNDLWKYNLIKANFNLLNFPHRWYQN